MIEQDRRQDQGRAIEGDTHLMTIQNQKRNRKRNIKTMKQKIKRIEKEG